MVETRQVLGPAPRLVLEILDPFEIAHHHAAAVGEYVGQHGHAALLQDPIGLGRERGVGALGDHACPHARRIAEVDLVTDRGGDQHIAFEFEQCGAVDGCGAGGAGERAVFGLVAHHAVEIEAPLGLRAYGTARVAERKDARAGFDAALRGDPPDFTATLDDHGAPAEAARTR
jgi:hypothetical protein